MQIPAFAASTALLNNTGVNPTSATSGNTGGIIVVTNKISYNDGDAVTISGTVDNYVSNTLVNLRIISPDANIVMVSQVDVGSDRTFSTTVTATGALWQKSGTYTVIVQYGSPDISSRTTFQFSGSSTGGQGNVGGPTNPNGNTTTAYQIVSANNHNTLTVKTDLPSYNQGDTIIVTSHVSQPDSSTAITLKIITPSKNLLFIGQFLPSSDGSFTKTFSATGPYWKDVGTYTITAQYGLYTNATTQFHYNGGNGQSIVTPAPGNISQASSAMNSTTVQPVTSKIPHWVKTVFNLYGQGQISDDDLISALKFLIQTGVIRVS